MRYFQFGYEAQLPDGRIEKGSFTISCETFPPQRKLNDFLCDGRIPSLKGYAMMAKLSYPSIFEFKNEEDYRAWIN